MRILFFTVLSLFITTIAKAQPVNDDCSGIIDLGIVPTCPSNTTIYNNVDATASDIGFGNIPACFNGGTVQNDVWFSYTTTADIVDITVSVLGSLAGTNGSILNPQIAIYRGSCEFDGLSELACISSANGDAAIRLDILGLTPNTTYFIRVNDYSATASPNWGDFTICAEEYVPDINIGDPAMTSACFGTLYDSGGPDNDYSNNENLSTTICPNDIHSCINIDLSSFNSENGLDVLNFYEGTDNTGELIATISGALNGNNYPVIVSSTCVTIEFTSDGSVVQEGFQLTWQCTPLECEASDFDNPTVINSLPFSSTNVSLCEGGATTIIDECPNSGFTSGPEYIFQYDAPGGFCASIQISNALAGTGVLVLNGLPGDPGTVCIAQGPGGTIASANFQLAGTYYIVVGNAQGCDDFNITISEADCILAASLVDALCNPLNGCIEDGGVPSVFLFEDGFEDVPMITGQNSGCWFGVGVQPDFFWFTIEAQADGPFGFIFESGDVPSDIDFNVWGPFTNDDVCENPANVIDFITNNEPIRSSYAGGTEPTGLADIHPTLGYVIEDDYDCNGINDDIVRTIPALEGEVYVVLANDWGDNIGDGGILVDWGPSNPAVLAPLPIAVVGSDTAVCPGQSVQLSLSSEVVGVEWIDPTGTLSCTACPNPIATINETTVYQVIVDAICYTDTVDVEVFVFAVDAGPDVTVCFGEEFQVSAGSNYEFADYSWDAPSDITLSCIDCPMPNVTASVPGTYVLTATLTTPLCTTDDELIITVLSDPAPEFSIIDDISICQGESIQIGGDATAGVIYNWTSNPVGFTSSDANPEVSPQENTTYIIAAENGQCPSPSLDSVLVSIEIPPILSIANDTTICQGEVIILGQTEIEDGVAYLWTGPGDIEMDTFPNTLATPQFSGTYTLTATRGICEISSSFEVNIVEIAVDIVPDTIEICLGTSITLDASVLPAGEQAVWVPNDGSLDTNTGNSVIATPLESTTYIASHSVPGCGRADTVFVRVDSLPNLTIMPIPEQDPYCMGDIVTLFSTTYEPSDFPDIEHQWISSGPGYQTPDTLWNMVFSATDTFIYQRISTNNACIDTAEILINVQIPPEMSITPSDTTICEGESTQLILSYAGEESITWMPEICDGCFDPIVTPEGTTTYNATSEDACPAMASAIVNVIPKPVISLVPPYTICDTETNETELFNGVPEAGVIYTWSSPDDPTVTATGFSLSVLPSMTTTYVLSAENDCTTVTAETTVIVVEEPALMLNDILICLGDQAVLEAISDLPEGINEIFEWSIDDTATGSTITIDDLTETTEVTLNYTYGNNCGTLTQTATISVVGNDFSVSLTAEPDSVFIGGSVVLTAIIASDPPLTGDVVYTWFQEGNQIGTTSVPTFTATISEGVTVDENLAFMVTVTSSDGCVRMAEASVLVLETGISIPNVFTPNGDDLNDVFKVYHTDGIEVSLVQVFNRWGEMVFESEADGVWNGTYKDQPAQSDVYIYRVIYTREGKEIEEGGEITLLR